MRATELVDDFVAKTGSTVSAGQSSSSKETKTLTAQYPADRSAGIDNSTGSAEFSALYQNGLLFTAYEYASKTSPDMRSMRSSVQKAYKILKSTNKIISAVQSVTGSSSSSTKNTTKTPVANILMPRSRSDVDSTNHKFNDVGESILTRGDNTATGILSNVASTAVFGALDTATQGILADYGEQIYNTSRSMYAGAENRTKTFTWELTPRSTDDLLQILKIYEIFNFYSYGVVGKSNFAKEIKNAIDEGYQKKVINPINEKSGLDVQASTLEAVTSFLSNVIVVSNPTVWFIQNFGTTSRFDGIADIFGPAQIQSMRFDKAPDGEFSGLAIAPNMPSTFVLEITFREILTLNRASIYGEDVL